MLLSASQSATRRTPFIFLKALMWLSPRLRMPITATRISSLAPATWDHDRAGQLKAPAATMEFLRNVRRVNGFIGLDTFVQCRYSAAMQLFRARRMACG